MKLLTGSRDTRALTATFPSIPNNYYSSVPGTPRSNLHKNSASAHCYFSCFISKEMKAQSRDLFENTLLGAKAKCA